jgi:hypothetical protein
MTLIVLRRSPARNTISVDGSEPRDLSRFFTVSRDAQGIRGTGL